MAFSSDTTDWTFRQEQSGRMALATEGEHVVNTVQHLFYLVPGTDPYNADRGLNIRGRLRRPYVDAQRDPEYEQLIRTQFGAYTDLVPVEVLCVYRERALLVVMTVAYNGKSFRLQLRSDPGQLDSDLAVDIQRL